MKKAKPRKVISITAGCVPCSGGKATNITHYDILPQLIRKAA